MKKIRKLFDFSDFLCSIKMKLLLGKWGVMVLILLGLPCITLAQKQKVTINVKDVDVQIVFKQIKEQTNLNFVYNADQLKAMESVTLNVRNVSVDAALAKLFEGTPFEYKFEMQSIVIKKKTERVGNEKMVLSGLVTDKNGDPLPGVAVLLKGSTVGTATDMDGNFKFMIPRENNVVLVFSFIGMKRQEVAVKDDKPLRVELEEDATELDEVVSYGYYNVDKRHMTSSVTSLKMDDIMMPGVSSVDQMLEGRVPGMIFMQNSGQVGAAPKIKIRGTTTVLGSQAPLWVLDGVILSDPVNIDPASINDLDFVNLLGNAISGINPDDIDKIDVLKDASATAIYGPRASNGVIVITTKKGKVGAPSVSYSLTGTFRQRPRYTDRAVNVMNSQERIDYSRDIVENKLEIPDLESWVGYESAYYDYQSGKINHEEFLNAVHKMETVNTDWLGILMKDSYSHNHTVSVSGGTDNIRYYASLGYSNENGNIRGEKNDRYSALTRLNLNYKNFTMQFGLNGSTIKKEYTPEKVGVTDYAYNTSRSIQAYDDNGDLWFYQKRKADASAYDQLFNIINERNNTYDKIKTEQIGLNVSLGYYLFPELKAEVFCSYNVSNSNEEIYFGEKTWYIAELRKKNAETGEIDFGKTLCPSGGELRLDNTKNENYSFRGSLTFNKSIDKEQEHVVSAAVIGELSSSRYSGFKITKRGYLPERGLIFDKIESMTDGNLYTKYNEWLLTDAARGQLKDNLTNLVGLIGTATYSYRNAYIFNVNARIDFSNKFGDASNDRLLPIWSVSGRWNMHENVLRNISWIDMLALKMSFGYQGNMSAQDSPRLIIKKGGTDNDFKEYSSTIDRYPNPNLKWEKTSTYNVDVDFSLFNNKINGTVGYYYRYTTDAFLSKKVSVVNGIDTYTVNSGNLKNQGYELTLNFVPINTMTTVNGKRRGLVWRFDPNFGSVFNQLIDKIKHKDQVLQDEVTFEDYLNGRVQISGRPVNTFYSYRYKGLNSKNGAPMFYGTEATTIVDGEEKDTSEIYEAKDRENVWMTVMEHSGCREPFLQGSISNYLGWKNWGLSFNLSYSIGSKIRLFRLYPNQGVVNGPEQNLRRELVNRWRRPGDELNTNVPGILSGRDHLDAVFPWWDGETYDFSRTLWDMYDFSNLRVASGNYLKLSSISLRYIVPESFCEKLRVKSLYLNLSGTNLFTLCSRKLKGQDPSQSGSTDLINISVRPTYSLQLNVTF